MNVLLICDDGFESIGFKILQEQSKLVWPANKFYYLAAPGESSGAGTAITTDPGKNGKHGPHVDFEVTGPNEARVYGSPVDCLYLGMYWPELLLGPRQRFDFVLSGVNRGANTGLDVVSSGTVAIAALASSIFGLPSMAFSQALTPDVEGSRAEKNERRHYWAAEQYVGKFLQTTPLDPGMCLNINFPSSEVKGYKNVPLGNNSRWFPALYADDRRVIDSSVLAEGYVTVTEISYSLAPPMRR